MRLDDSRRLFGPNLDTDGPAAIAEVFFEPDEDEAEALAGWRARAALVVDEARLHVRIFRGGAALVIDGQFDELLPLCDVNEAAIAGTVDVVALRLALTSAADPALRDLVVQTRARGLPVLVDDANVSVGLGKHAVVAPRGAPLDWAAAGRIPVVLVTGTNGKTTTARLIARIAAENGLCVGLATTDSISVGGTVLESGDMSGPDSARKVLRHPDVELAVLETARGGILRRGLAVDRADVAVLTNVSADHLGSYGIDDVDTMARVKRVVAKVADHVVVNAADPRTFAGLSRPLTTFGLDGTADWTVVAGALRDLPIADIPITFRGSARHNVANAVAAAATADVLGLPWPATRRALVSFTASENPGRGNLVDVGGRRVLLDFGHNPAGVKAMLVLARGLTTARLFVVLGLPGDRDDTSLREVARSVAAAAPERVFLHDLTGYLRGRQPGAVPNLVAEELERAAIAPIGIERTDSETAGLARALAEATPGDLVVVFPHLEREAVAALLAGG